MKKNVLPLFFAVGACITAHGQISLTQANMPDAGMIFTSDQVEPDYSDTMSIGAAGAALVWNFSNLPLIDFPQPEYFLAASATPHADLFPNANLCTAYELSDTADYQYYILNAGSMALAGFAQSSDGLTFTPPLQQFTFPLTYQSSFSQTSNISGSFEGVNVTGTAKTSVNADAWGTVTTDLGTFNCLRVKRITEITINVLIFSIIQRDTIYEWWTPEFKSPVFEYDRNFSSVLGEEEYGGYARVLLGQTTGAQEPVSKKNTPLEVFPNPVSMGSTQLNFQVPFTAQVEWMLVDAQGKVQARNDLGQLQAGAYTENIDMARLAPGVYVLLLRQGGELTGLRQVVKNE
jgi:hypothetical protein